MSLYLGEQLIMPTISFEQKDGFTGNVDAEGLAEIGWTDDDIAWLQDDVWWNCGDDDKWLVGDAEKTCAEIIQLMADESEDITEDQSINFISNAAACRFVPAYLLQALPSSDGGMLALRSVLPNMVAIPLFNAESVSDASTFFIHCANLRAIPALDTSNVRFVCISEDEPFSMFRGCKNLIKVPELDFSNVACMNSLFDGCSSLTSIGQLNTASATDMSNMFINCTSLLTIPLLNTSSVTNMYRMFKGCASLTAIPQLDTSNVTSMGGMFYGCTSLTTIPLLDVSSVTGMGSTFSECYCLTTCNLTGLQCNLNLKKTNISKESLLFMIEHAKSVTDKELVLGDFNLTKLTENEIAVMTDKGWTVV